MKSLLVILLGILPSIAMIALSGYCFHLHRDGFGLIFGILAFLAIPNYIRS